MATLSNGNARRLERRNRLRPAAAPLAPSSDSAPGYNQCSHGHQANVAVPLHMKGVAATNTKSGQHNLKLQSGLRSRSDRAWVTPWSSLRSRHSAASSHWSGSGQDQWRHSEGQLASHALASLRSHLPNELADKARALGSAKGERKQVTVVFADLSGFTSVSETQILK